jgi:hypothetical protein
MENAATGTTPECGDGPLLPVLRSMEPDVHPHDHYAGAMEIVTAKQSYFSRNSHIGNNDLEAYALGRIYDEAELAPIEEHLLVCDVCQDRLCYDDNIARDIRGVLRLIVWRSTLRKKDGPVELSVYRSAGTEYTARIIGGGVDSGGYFHSVGEAQAWCELTFAMVFPEWDGDI